MKMIMPDRCIRCGELTGGGPGLCAVCKAGLRPFPRTACAVCGRELGSAGICIACSVCDPPYDRVVSAVVYDGTVKELLHEFKYHRKTSHKSFLAGLLCDALQHENMTADILSFVPMHWTRQIVRGYNQAALLTIELGCRLGIRVRYDVLRKTKRTPAQVGLSLKKREKNLRGVFEARHVDGKSVMVVDDVITSGSTAWAVAAALKNAGAGQVTIASVARVLS